MKVKKETVILALEIQNTFTEKVAVDCRIEDA